MTPPAPSARAESHEWPWNRRTEIVPTTTVTVTPTAADMPPPALQEIPSADAIHVSAPAIVAPEPAPEITPPPATMAEPEPQGPARKGWWRRLTS